MKHQAGAELDAEGGAVVAGVARHVTHQLLGIDGAADGISPPTRITPVVAKVSQATPSREIVGEAGVHDDGSLVAELVGVVLAHALGGK